MTPLVLVTVQALLVAESARRIERLVTRGQASLVARLLVVQVLALAQIVAVTLALGYSGQLRTATILLAHLAVLLAALAFARRPAGDPAPLLASMVAAARRWEIGERLAAVGLGAGLSLVVLTGVLGEHITHDALTYRLSRIGYWLQEGSIRHFPTNELRQSYSPVNVDLVMLWLTHPLPTGFPLVTLAQAWGGGLLLLATWSVAGAAGLGRASRLGVLALLLGAPSILVQLMTSQNDLLTAGLASASLALGLESLGRERLTLPAWLAIALAVGAKGTVFYVLPGLVLLAAAVARRKDLAPRALARHAACAVSCLALVGAPRYVENLRAWGDPFAPREFYAANQGEVAVSTIGEKTILNAITYVAEAADPSSNAAVLAPVLRPVWRALVSRLPDRDPFTGPAYNRRPSLLFFSGQPLRNADTLSTGAVLPLLALVGALGALARAWRRPRQAADRLALGLAAAAAAFGLVFSALFQWWPTNVRFFSLVAVPLGVLAGRALVGLPVRVRRLAWGLALALGAAIGGEVYGGTFNAGWQALHEPPRAFVPWWGDHLAELALARSLPPGTTLGVALRRNTVLAGLFRGGRGVRVVFVPLEIVAAAGDGQSLMRSERLSALLTRPGLAAGGARVVPIAAGTDRPLELFLRALPSPLAGSQQP